MNIYISCDMRVNSLRMYVNHQVVNSPEMGT